MNVSAYEHTSHDKNDNKFELLLGNNDEGCSQMTQINVSVKNNSNLIFVSICFILFFLFSRELK